MAKKELPVVDQGKKPKYSDDRLKSLCKESVKAKHKVHCWGASPH